LAVDGEIPRNAECAGFDANNNRIARVEAIVVIFVHREALDPLSLAPGVDKQAAVPRTTPRMLYRLSTVVGVGQILL